MHPRNKIVSGLMLVPLVVLVSPPVMAGPSVKSGAVVQELTVLEQQGALLQQQLKNAQLRQEIASAQKTPGCESMSAGLGSPSFNGPSVLLLTGGAGHYSATIRLPNGQIAPAMVGNILPGGYRITKISGDGVWTIHDGRAEALPFAVENASDGLTSGMGSADDRPASLPAASLPNMFGSSLPGANPMMGANASSGLQQPVGQP